MSNDVGLPPVKIEGTGAFSLPPGMTPEEAERLIEEAERERGNA